MNKESFHGFLQNRSFIQKSMIYRMNNSEETKRGQILEQLFENFELEIRKISQIFPNRFDQKSQKKCRIIFKIA